MIRPLGGSLFGYDSVNSEQFENQQQHDQGRKPQQPKDDMINCVMSLEAALLPCLPARELQAVDRSAHPSHQIDVERHARDFMEASKKLQLYFINLQYEARPTEEETLRRKIAIMEEELKTKSEKIQKQEKLIQLWRDQLNKQQERHFKELDRV
ncbi:mediator of RNA polymerase II transcription subunit 28 isoform X1 [Amborella trichopoda]|uniref:mediator of RNA polymerase II transcription subunit 28 isoform X1 n=1 Tax=Amborella trichopoda TaxID=13333 RepID=UPI0005D3C463|nr:mediator of RNA polymerase II transcription subunit 28 isoform X1 [Amborella trichopoda]|eukprot:XP_006844448.2 mediator of RNA polymerase II transcription subunit 28 isoform X1 [Amborella trichopoda]